jgi:hypothetical protein
LRTQYKRRVGDQYKNLVFGLHIRASLYQQNYDVAVFFVCSDEKSRVALRVSSLEIDTRFQEQSNNFTAARIGRNN